MGEICVDETSNSSYASIIEDDDRRISPTEMHVNNQKRYAPSFAVFYLFVLSISFYSFLTFCLICDACSSFLVPLVSPLLLFPSYVHFSSLPISSLFSPLLRFFHSSRLSPFLISLQGMFPPVASLLLFVGAFLFRHDYARVQWDFSFPLLLVRLDALSFLQRSKWLLTTINPLVGRFYH